MSLYALIIAAGSLGLLGGLHCIAMCAAAQRVAIHGVRRGAALGPDARPSAQALQPLRFVRTSVGVSTLPATGVPTVADLAFHAARLSGYAVLGALIGGGSSVLRWGAEVAPLFRPLWGGINAALLALGLALLILGRQPAWIDALGQRLWTITGARMNGSVSSRPVAAGAAWALLPCGLLYSALAVAMLASDALRGAMAMLAFGLGTTVNLLGAQALLHRLVNRLSLPASRVETTGIRIGGAMLATMAVAALVALAFGLPHPFCAS